MTVGELIERLRAFPADLPVIVNGTRNELANGQACGVVELLDQYSDDDGETWQVDYFPDLRGEDERHRNAVNVRAGKPDA